MVASPDGKYLYVGSGSNSNVGENGLDMEKLRAAILRIDAKTGDMALYASGLRNPVGLAWNPWSGALWTVVNERDEIGNDLVPDYLTSVKPGAFYGWPWSYYGQHTDSRPEPKNPAAVAAALSPDYAMGPHVAAPRAGLLGRPGACPEVRARRVRRRAWQLEPQAVERIPGRVRALCRSHADRCQARRRS